MSNTTQFDIIDSINDANTIGLSLWGQPVTVQKGGLRDFVMKNPMFRDTTFKDKTVNDGIIISTVEALKTLDMWSPVKERKYCSEHNVKHLLTERGRAREAFKSFARDINGWKLNEKTKWVLDQLKTTHVKDGNGFSYPVAGIIQILTNKASRKIVDGQPLAEHGQYIQLLPDFRQEGYKFLMADLERRLLRGEDITVQHEYTSRGKTRMSYIPRSSIGIIAMMMHSEWSNLFRKYNSADQWDEEYDVQERPVSNHTLIQFGGQDGLRELFEYAGLSTTQQRYLFAYIEGKVGEHLTDGSISDIARWMGCSAANVVQVTDKALRNLASADIFGCRGKDEVINISKIKVKNKLTRKEKADDKKHRTRVQAEQHQPSKSVKGVLSEADRDAYEAAHRAKAEYFANCWKVSKPVDEFDPWTE